MKKWLLVAFSAAFAMSVSAAPFDGPMKRGANMIKVLKQLDLSDQQKDAVRDILDSAREDVDIFADSRKQQREAIKQLVAADDWDQAAVEQAFLVNAEQHQQRKLNAAQVRHQVWNVLDAEQQAELASFSARELPERDENKRQKMWNRVSKRIGITDTQQQEIDAIRSAFEVDKTQIRETIKAHRDAEKALIRTSDFDQAQWDAMFAEHQAFVVDLAVSKAYMQHQVLQVLTPEQREELSKVERKMRKKMRGRA